MRTIPALALAAALLAPPLAAPAADPAGGTADRSVGRPYQPNPRVTLERHRLGNIKPLDAERAHRALEGEARENIPLQATAKRWDEVGFTLDPVPAPPEDGDPGDATRAVPVNFGLGFVRPLQQALARAGFYVDGLKDGYFGVHTSSELRRFQRAQGLPETGWADRATVAKLNAVTGSRLDEGAGEAFAAGLKASLRYLGHRPGPVDGTFDRATMAAVTEFQIRNRVESGGMYGGSFKIVRGWVDRATAERINEAVRRKREAAGAGE